MKTYIPLALLISLAAFSIITFAADSSPEVLHATFVEGAEAIRWQGEANWERVNDKANGALDEASFVPKNLEFSQLTVKFPDGEINPITEKSVLRMKVRVRLEGVLKSDVARLECRLSDHKGQNFYIGTFSTAALRLDIQHPANVGEANMGQWQTQRLTRDEQYHVYTLEIHPDKRVTVLVDDTAFDERDIGDPDLNVAQVSLLFIGTPQSAGKWYIDDVSITREPSVSKPVQKP